MKKFFVVSDIHGFYDEFMKSLNKAGFDVNNQDHVLIVCGDIFDRGTKPLDVYHFLRSLPRERRILIRGNHETLFKELVKKRRVDYYDESNKTYHTLFQLLGMDLEQLRSDYFEKAFKDISQYDSAYGKQLRDDYQKSLTQVFYSDIAREIIQWIDSDEWVNYYETDKYIFVHAWIPLYQQIDWENSVALGYMIVQAEFFRDDWRNATQTEWEDAMWYCPWKKCEQGLNHTGKTIVCGHWHTSDFFNHLTKHRKGKYDCPIFNSKKHKLIGLDACTVISHKVNVLVLNEDRM